MEPFRKFFQTRPISKTLLLVGIILTSIGYWIELEGLLGAGFALVVGAAVVAMATEG